MKFGAIDIGTNAARLLVGEVYIENEFKLIQKISYSRIPLRLGEDVFENGFISPKKTDHFIKSIKAFSLISEIFEVKQLRACATSAMREAANAFDVKAQIEKETGINIEIISGDEEADLIFGTFFMLDFDRTIPFIVIDVGGGSTEVSVFARGERVASKSFDIGTLRLLKGKTSDFIWTDIHDWLSLHVDIKSLHQIFATGGNINKTHKLLGAGHMEPIHINAIQKLRDNLNSLSMPQRINKYQLRPDRADVLVPALDIYLFIMKKLDCHEMIVPKIGLSDGMIYDMYLKHDSL